MQILMMSQNHLHLGYDKISTNCLFFRHSRFTHEIMFLHQFKLVLFVKYYFQYTYVFQECTRVLYNSHKYDDQVIHLQIASGDYYIYYKYNSAQKKN